MGTNEAHTNAATDQDDDVVGFASDLLLPIPDLVGESARARGDWVRVGQGGAADGHKDWINLLSVSHSITRPI